MARQESDREDMFAEAISLVRRWEGFMPACSVPMLAGFKPHGDLSVYFGPDRVYHCNIDGRLRRAFVDGFLYRSHGDGVSRLRRERSETETALLRTNLTPDEIAVFRVEMTAHLRRLRDALVTNAVTTLRRFPEDDHPLESDLAMVIGTIMDADPWLAPAVVRR